MTRGKKKFKQRLHKGETPRYARGDKRGLGATKRARGDKGVRGDKRGSGRQKRLGATKRGNLLRVIV